MSYLPLARKWRPQSFDEVVAQEDITTTLANAINSGRLASAYLFAGPRGTGKSQMIEFMKRKITGQVIYTLKGCDNNDHPMWITPLNKRNALAEEYGFMPGSTPSALPTHPTFRGDICPQCRLRLEQEYNFEWRKFPVVKRKISSRRGVGIAVVDPVDPNNQDIGVLIGTISIKDLDKYDEGDPRTMVLRGAFNKMNRGIGEFREGWNNDSQYLYPIIFSTQEGTVDSPGQYELVSHDSCQVFHSNMGSWHKFLSDPNSEALIGRVEPILYRHLLRYTEEAKVYEKERQRSLYGRSNISPHTLEALAFHAVITRCDPQIDKPIGYDKALIYDGFGIDPMNTPQKLLQMSPKDGLMGLDSRFFTKVLGEAYARSGGACLIWSDLRNQVSQSLKRNFEVGELTLPEFNYFQEVLAQADVFYLNSLDNDLKFISSKAMQELALNLFYKYCDHLRRWSVRHKARIHSQDESIFPEYSEDVLSVIEKHLGVRANDLDGFREEFVDWLIDYETRNKEQPKWDVHPRLRRAIESVLWTRLQNILRIPQSSALLSEEDALIYRSVVAEMLTRGYHEDCVDRVLASASDLWTT